MKLVRISDVHGPIFGTCFSDCIATCAKNLNTPYELMYIGALSVKVNEANDNKSFWERLLFPVHGISNLLNYHGIKLVEKSSFDQLVMDSINKQLCIVEMLVFYCPWEKNYRAHKNHTHSLISNGYYSQSFQCVDPYYNITNGLINQKEMQKGYKKHFCVELSPPTKIFDAEILKTDILESISCLSTLQKEFRINNDRFITSDRERLLLFSDVLFQFSYRTAGYYLFLNYCNTEALLFSKPVEQLLHELFKLSLKWIVIFTKIKHFDLETLYHNFPSELGVQCEKILGKEIETLSCLCATI